MTPTKQAACRRANRPFDELRPNAATPDVAGQDQRRLAVDDSTTVRGKPARAAPHLSPSAHAGPRNTAKSARHGPRKGGLVNVRVVTFLLGSLFAATASAQTKEVARDGFSCDASRLADLPRDVAAAVARDTCDALARLSGRTG